MKELLIGLLAFGSISAFSFELNVENNTKPEVINLEVKADKIVTATVLSTITYFNIRLESDKAIVNNAKSARFLNNLNTYNGLCAYLGHRYTVDATSTSSGFSNNEVELLYSNVSSDWKSLSLVKLYSANYLKDLTCIK